MVEFKSRDPLAIGQYGRRCQLTQLSAIDESLQYVLLDIQVIVVNGGESLA